MKQSDLPRGSKVSKKQKESALQRLIVSSLITCGYGHFFRIRNGATFDPVAKIFRANTAEKGIPDIIGFLKGSGQAVFIEVKFQETIENRKKITHKVKISDEQKAFLRNAHLMGCRAGIAFTMDDALAIVTQDYDAYPRHPRTWAFLDDEEAIKEKAAQYELQKEVPRKERRCPAPLAMADWREVEPRIEKSCPCQSMNSGMSEVLFA